MTTITQYYAYINAKNYQAAYNLWGTAYQQSTFYQPFASGFATTQNDIVHINMPMALADGTVKVPVYIIATVLDASLIFTKDVSGPMLSNAHALFGLVFPLRYSTPCSTHCKGFLLIPSPVLWRNCSPSNQPSPLLAAMLCMTLMAG